MIVLPLAAQPPRKPASQSVAKKPAPASPAAAPDDLSARIAAQQAAIQSGDTAAVEQTSRKLIASALRRMAMLRTATGDWTGAIAAYRQSLELEDSNPVRLELAVAYLAADQPDNAIEECEKVVITDPRNAVAWDIQGKAFAVKADYRRAAEALTRYLELEKNVDAQYALAFALLKVKEKEKAQQVFQQMLQDYGDRAIWHEVFGGAYRENKYLDEAIVEFQTAAKMDPKLAHVHAFLGETLLEKNYWAPDPAILHEFDEEVKAYPDGYFGNFYMGVLLAQQGDLEAANPHLQAAIKADPQNPDPWLYYGLNQFKVKDYAGATTSLKKAIELTGSDDARANYQIRRAYISLGRILTTQGDKAAAEPYLKKARELSDKSLSESSSAIAAQMAESGGGDPGSSPAVISDASLKAVGAAGGSGIGDNKPQKPNLTPEQTKAIEQSQAELRTALGTAYNDWGTSEARQRNYARALVYFQAAEKWDPATPAVMRNLGLAAFRLGDSREAARALDLALQQNPNDRAVRGMLAMSYFTSQQFAEASKTFDAMGESVYADPRLTYAYAFSLAHSQELIKAVDVLHRFSAMPPPSDMMLAVGDLYAQTGDLDDALKTYLELIQRDPTIPRAHYYAGESLIKLGRPDEAIAQFEQEMKITPDDSNVQYHYAYALLQTSRKDDALKILRTITAEHPDHAQAQYQLGKTLLDAGQYQEAIEHLELAAKYDPKRDYVHYQLQAAYRKAGRTADADRESAIYRDLKNQQRDKGSPQPKQ